MAAPQDRTSLSAPTGGPRNLLLSVRGLGAQTLLAFGLMAVAAAGRVFLGFVDPDVVPAGVYLPAIVAAALIGGWRAGALALGFCIVANLGVLGTHFAAHTATRPINIALFVVVSCFGVAVAQSLGALVVSQREARERLAARNLHYDTLFETITEGFAVCEAIRDEAGRLIDYTVKEMNPALMELLGVGPERVGGRMREAPGQWRLWLQVCERILETGEPATFESPGPLNGRWFEIRVSRLTGETMAQFFIDITDRKSEQVRQAALFDELNHRVKNNLAIVSSVLSMQAREAEPAAADALRKAVARVHSIGDLHASLYKTHRTEDVDAGLYLRELGENLSKSLLADERIRILVEAPSVVMSTDSAVVLGLVVSELVTNAVKYAYAPDQAGEIRVGLTVSPDGAVLAISDDGRGLAIDAPVPEGLGMRLVRSMVSQVDGEVIVGASEGRGAQFEIRLPPSSLAARAA